MQKYFHSVTLDRDKCRGCTNCIKRCPTEAIRVQNGKAKIIDERCIDCGECIRVCPYHAKKAITDPLDNIFDYKYKIALPAPTLYGQFKDVLDVNVILTALKKIGFDEIFEVAIGAEIVSEITNQIITTGKIKKPIISSACPAVVKLISVRFPNLIKNVIPIQSPMEVAARIAKEEAARRLNMDIKDIGAFFISPCAAKLTSTKEPIGMEASSVDGVISIKEIYLKLVGVMNKLTEVEQLFKSNSVGISWANSGGESGALENEEIIAVDGINNVIKVLEELEDDKLSDIDFVELLACTGGCVGGPLAVENGFVAQNRVKRIAKFNNGKSHDIQIEKFKDLDIFWDKPMEYEPVMKLDSDIVEAMKKMEAIDKIYEGLPDLDCGACGSPSCRALAEDIVRGFANETDCIFKLREKVRILAKEMMKLEEKMPPAFRKEDEEKEKENEDKK